jgi:hypothetical protein
MAAGSVVIREPLQDPLQEGGQSQNLIFEPFETILSTVLEYSAPKDVVL